MSPLRVVFLMLAILIPMSAQEAAPLEVPDPYGLGPRLALIAHLREAYAIQPPAGATLDELQALHREAARGKALAETQEFGIDAEVDDEAMARDRARRLREVLRNDFRIEVPDGTTEDQMRGLLTQAQQQRDEQIQADIRAKNPGRAPEAPAREPMVVEGEIIRAPGLAAPPKPDEAGNSQAAWRAQVDRDWKRLEALPTTWEATWAGAYVQARDAAAYRIEKADGATLTAPAFPVGTEGINRVWWRKDTQWRPMTWDPVEQIWEVSNLTYLNLRRTEAPFESLVLDLIARPSAKRPGQGEEPLPKRFGAARSALAQTFAKVFTGIPDPVLNEPVRTAEWSAYVDVARQAEADLALPGFASAIDLNLVFAIRRLAFETYNATLQKAGDGQGDYLPSAMELAEWRRRAESAQAALHRRQEAITRVMAGLPQP